MVSVADRNAAAASDPVSWWWLETEKLRSQAPVCLPLSGERQVDVVIVGGGFTGLWTALALKERQPCLNIALLEEHTCGSGASGKNGGNVSGYWSSLPSLVRLLGADAALNVAKAGTRAQDAIRAFATRPGIDVWWREDGNMRIATAASHDEKIDDYISTFTALGISNMAIRLTPEQVAERFRSPAARGGVYFSEGAIVHPARLALALRDEALRLGVTIHEHSPMVRLDCGDVNRVRTPAGALLARDVVLATNVKLATDVEVSANLCVFSSYALMTAPATAELEAMGWAGNEGITDLRMFLHYFRKTPDGRVLMGSGSGPVGYKGRVDNPQLYSDQASAERAISGLRNLLPTLGTVAIEKVWGAPIDMAPDRLPFFRTRQHYRIHYGCGYSGHGVNATYIGGQCLASLVLNENDYWANLPFCTRKLSAFPPEPWRTLGARTVRHAILNCEEAEHTSRHPSITSRFIASLPAKLGLRLGTR